MKKSLAMMVVAGLAASAFVAPAATAAKKKPKAKPRVVTVAYQAPGIGATTPAAGGGLCPFADPTTQTCIEIVPKLGEKYIKVEILDTTGQKVAGYISQGDTDGDGIGDLYGDFCGAHAAPIAMQAAALVRVSFYAGACDDGTPSTPTTGTVKVTFYKKV